MTPTELANELSITPKQLRDWLRATHRRSPAEHGQRWTVTAPMATAARAHFRSRAR